MAIALWIKYGYRRRYVIDETQIAQEPAALGPSTETRLSLHRNLPPERAVSASDGIRESDRDSVIEDLNGCARYIARSRLQRSQHWNPFLAILGQVSIDNEMELRGATRDIIEIAATRIIGLIERDLGWYWRRNVLDLQIIRIGLSKSTVNFDVVSLLSHGRKDNILDIAP